MACCVAIGLVISLIRRAFYALLGREPVTEEPFAPTARRAAPVVATASPELSDAAPEPALR